MQDIKPLTDYYQESQRKNKRRYELLKQFFEYLVVQRGFNDNMSKICKEIGVERKTVYRYYNSKEDIIAEVSFYIHIKRNNELQEKIKEVLKNDELDAIDKFIVIMNLQVEMLTKYQNDMAFSEYSRRIITNLNHDSETYKRYIHVMNAKEFNHYHEILKVLELNGELREDITSERYAQTIGQMIYSFVSQTLEYENNFNNFKNANVSKVIQLIARSVLKNY